MDQYIKSRFVNKIDNLRLGTNKKKKKVVAHETTTGQLAHRSRLQDIFGDRKEG